MSTLGCIFSICTLTPVAALAALSACSHHLMETEKRIRKVLQDRFWPETAGQVRISSSRGKTRPVPPRPQ